MKLYEEVILESSDKNFSSIGNQILNEGMRRFHSCLSINNKSCKEFKKSIFSKSTTEHKNCLDRVEIKCLQELKAFLLKEVHEKCKINGKVEPYCHLPVINTIMSIPGRIEELKAEIRNRK